MEEREGVEANCSWTSSLQNILSYKYQQSLFARDLSSPQRRAKLREVIENPISPKLVAGSYADNLPKNDHPVNWTNDDVIRWVRWCFREYSLYSTTTAAGSTDNKNEVNNSHVSDSCCSSIDSDVISARFNMNGKALCILSKEAFLNRCPEYGDLLFHIFCLFKQKWDEIYSPTLLQISSLLGLELAYPSSTALLLLHNQLALHEHQQLQQQQPILRQCLTQSVPSAPPTSHTLHHPAPMESKPVVPATHLALILEKALMSHYHHHQQEKCEDDKSYACTTPRQGFPHIQGNGRSMTVMGFSGDHVTPEEIQERTKAAATAVPLVSPSSIPHWSPSATVEHGGPGVGSRLDRLPSSSSDHHHYNHPQQLQQHHHPSLGLDLRRPRPPPPPSLRTQQNISSCSSMTKVKGEEAPLLARDGDYSHKMEVPSMPLESLSYSHKDMQHRHRPYSPVSSFALDPLSFCSHRQTQFITRGENDYDVSPSPTSNTGFSHQHLTSEIVPVHPSHRYLTSPITPSPPPLVHSPSAPPSPRYPLLSPPRNMKTEPKLLWAFLHSLLTDQSGQYSHMIRWVESNHPSSPCPSPNTFRILEPNDVAKLWGAVKNRSNMTYEKMSRALRYYYKMKIIRKEPGKKLTYRFLQSPSSLRDSLKPLGRKPNQQTPSRIKLTAGSKIEKYQKQSLYPEEPEEENEEAHEEGMIAEKTCSVAERCEENIFEEREQTCRDSAQSYAQRANTEHEGPSSPALVVKYENLRSVLTAIASDANNLHMLTDSTMK